MMVLLNLKQHATNSVGPKEIRQKRQHTVSSLLPKGWVGHIPNIYNNNKMHILSKIMSGRWGIKMGIHHVDMINVYRMAFVAGVKNAAPIVHQLLRTLLLSKRFYRVRIPFNTAANLGVNSIKAALHHSAVLQNCILFLMRKVIIDFGSCTSNYYNI